MDINLNYCCPGLSLPTPDDCRCWIKDATWIMLHLAPYHMFYVFLGYPVISAKSSAGLHSGLCWEHWILSGFFFFFWWRISTKKHCLILRDRLTLQIWPYSFPPSFPCPSQMLYLLTLTSYTQVKRLSFYMDGLIHMKTQCLPKDLPSGFLMLRMFGM